MSRPPGATGRRSKGLTHKRARPRKKFRGRAFRFTEWLCQIRFVQASALSSLSSDDIDGPQDPVCLPRPQAAKALPPMPQETERPARSTPESLPVVAFHGNIFFSNCPMRMSGRRRQISRRMGEPLHQQGPGGIGCGLRRLAGQVGQGIVPLPQAGISGRKGVQGTAQRLPSQSVQEPQIG